MLQYFIIASAYIARVYTVFILTLQVPAAAAWGAPALTCGWAAHLG